MKLIAKFTYITVLTLFLQCFVIAAYTQTYHFQNLTTDNGLAVSQVLSMYQHTDGELWFGTHPGGINKFNGLNFSYLQQEHGIAGNTIMSMARGDGDEVYIGTSSGLSITKNGIHKNYTTVDGLKSDLIFKVFRNNKGEMLLGTQQGANIMDKDGVRPLTLGAPLDTIPVFNFYEDSNGNLWVATVTDGVFRYDGRKLKNFRFNTDPTDHFASSVIEIKPGIIWVTNKKGIFEIIGDQSRKVEVLGLVDVDFYCSLKDSRGIFWFGSDSGLVKYDGDFHLFTTKNGLVNNVIWAILEDEEGIMWFASRTQGVSRIKNEAFVEYTEKDGLQNKQVNCIVSSNLGSCWIANKSGIGLFNNRKFSPLEFRAKKDQLSDCYVIKEEANGNLWLGTSYGLYLKKPDGKAHRFLATKRGQNMIRAIEIGEDGTIWLGTHQGICKLVNDKIQYWDNPNNKENLILDIQIDNKQNVWFGGDEGLFFYSKDSLKWMGPKQGFSKVRVRSLLKDPKSDKFWIATNDGLYCYQNNVFVKWTTNDGLVSNIIFSMAFDSEYGLWVGMPKGIMRLTIVGDELKEVHGFDLEDGFIGLECMNNAIYINQADIVFVGTVNGLNIINTKLYVKNKVPPKLKFNDIKLFREQTDWIDYADKIDQSGFPIDLKLPYHQNHLSFDYIGVSHSTPKKVTYKYQLQGLDEGWIKSKTNQAIYSNIPPGEYTFVINADNGEGTSCKDPISFSFEILPPFWQTWWFYGICISIGLIGIYSYISIRTAKAEIEIQKIKIEGKNANLNIAYSEIREQKQEAEKQRDDAKEQRKEANRQRVIAEENQLIATQQWKEAVSLQEKLSEKNRKITDSIEYAAHIQNAILTSDAYWQRILPQHFILFKPRDIVSGDFYWAYETPSQKKVWIAADCTGHGVPGGFMSMLGNTFLNEIIIEQGEEDSAKILDRLRDDIIKALASDVGSDEGLEMKDGMDLALCILHNDLTLEYAGANNPLWIVSKSREKPIQNRQQANGLGEIRGARVSTNETEDMFLHEIKADKQPVGKYVEMTPFTTHKIQLEKGDQIYTFSDGFPDQFGGPKLKKYMSKRLKKFLFTIADKSMIEQKDLLHLEFEKWRGTGEQIDDVCIIGVKI